MQGNIGEIITDTPNGESRDSVIDDAAISDTERIAADSDLSEGTGNKDTERIATPGSDSGTIPGIRITKNGKPDGRSLRRLNRESIGKNTTEKPLPVINISLTDVILNIHNIGASLLRSELVKLDPSEAEQLSKAVQEVNKYYGANFDPKKVAMFNLITCAGSIYAPRVIAAMNMRDVKKVDQPAPAPNTVPINTAKNNVPKRDISTMTPSELFGTTADGSL